MDNDLYVDCPSCGHTVKVANDLIGAMVECPDCSFDFEVPDIREGLNPRFRRDEESVPGPEYGLPDLGHLQDGLKSLLRRNRAQVDQIDLLTENTDLLLKQVNMLTPARMPNAAEGKITQTGTAEANPTWFRWSLICGCISVAAALIVAVVLLV
ncbi:MAG: hypothetical protein PF795_02150 [Kiritimatiellae bacterium]|jgi:DNA-directed RNA polymerase subunit RPC12/RpoP|nr:hypothetical protein [Kiritimatiellia bacterium]